MSNQIVVMADRLKIDPQELNDIIVKTIMPSKVQVSNEQLVSFMAVANEYGLNPLIKEIYAFPAKGGGIQPVVSVDGWLKIIINHPQFDGMEHEDVFDDSGKLSAIKCSIYRKDQSRPVSVTEYMSECCRNTDVWKNWPNRMLRHKVTIQCGRYTFGISGIQDPDEVERQREKDITPEAGKNTSILEELVANKGVEPEWLKGILSEIIHANHPGELNEIYMLAMNECKLHDDGQAAKAIQDECNVQKKYFEKLEAKANG